MIEKRPWGQLVEDEMLWVDLIQTLVDECRLCSKSAISEMPSYVKTLSNGIEDEISKVELNVTS